MMRRAAACLIAVGAVVLTPAIAHADKPDTSPCKNGGYVLYVDPVTYQPFENQGQCVSFVARGGVLSSF